MFLDDELLEMCRNAKTDTAEEIIELSREVFGKCDDYYKSKIKPKMRNSDLKIVLDKTFNLFDSFVSMALKSDDVDLKILGNAFSRTTYRKLFLEDPVYGKIYREL